MSVLLFDREAALEHAWRLYSEHMAQLRAKPALLDDPEFVATAETLCDRFRHLFAQTEAA